MKKKIIISLVITLFVLLLAIGFWIYFSSLKVVAFNYIEGGSTFMMHDIANVVKKKGYKSFAYPEKLSDLECQKIDYNIIFRGDYPYTQNVCKAKHNIMWLSHSELKKINGVEVDGALEEYADTFLKFAKDYDAIILSSKQMLNYLKNKTDIPLFYAPQFTNPKKFYYEYDENVQSKILFVGHPHFLRVSPIWALKNNLPITIYGAGWGMYQNIIGFDIKNEELHRYYSSSEIVLNDTMPSMKKFGFVSNRIYDVTACKSLILTDYMKEIEEVYGDSIPMWKNEKEFVELANYYLNHPEERKQKAQKAHEITMKHYTVDKVADDIIQAIKTLK